MFFQLYIIYSKLQTHFNPHPEQKKHNRRQCGLNTPSRTCQHFLSITARGSGSNNQRPFLIYGRFSTHMFHPVFPVGTKKIKAQTILFLIYLFYKPFPKHCPLGRINNSRNVQGRRGGTREKIFRQIQPPHPEHTSRRSRRHAAATGKSLNQWLINLINEKIYKTKSKELQSCPSFHGPTENIAARNKAIAKGAQMRN